MNPRMLPTPINAVKLSRYLEGYDKTFTSKIITGFTLGFRLDFVGERKNSFAPNLLSAREFPEVIDSKIASEVALGRIVGPFDSPPVQPLWVSPVGVVPKKIKGEYRMIQHLSYPEGSSVNDGIPRELSTVHYATVDDAIALIKKCGRGGALAKTDIKSAFRILPVHPSDYQLLGFHWKGKLYVDRCLPMGCSSSCRIFEEFSTCLEWIARNKLGIRNIIHILDDFLIIDQSLSSCREKLAVFLDFCNDLGVPIAKEKTEGPNSILSFAGIELDCRKFEARLPQEKIQKCLSAIEYIASRKKATLKELQSVIGLLNFACSVIIPGRVFLRRLINMTIGVKRPHHYIRLTQEVKHDLLLWKSFFQSHNGKSMFLEDAWYSSSHLKFYTDAAQSLGFGIVFDRKWVYGKWPPNWNQKNIAFLELFPIVLGVHMWGESLRNRRVLFFSDNESVVHVINKQTSKDKGLLQLIRQLVLICLQYNILFRARHIQGKKNILADSLSRLQVDKFKALATNVEESPSIVPRHLLPENWEKF